MAIATFDRDAARSGAGSEPRFKLVEELFRTGDAVFWRAEDRRSHRSVTVRIIDVGREDSTRRLGDLHRERTLADRLGHPEVLRTDVPLIEADRIFQLVDPQPVSSMDSMRDVARLPLLMLLVAAARVLAEAHARGVFHGAFTRSSCLRAADGRLILQGFTGDAPAAAAVRDGMAADHHAFLVLADELLQASGGPPPRLRRYFQRELAPGAARPAPNALANLADELRESLEDTFPWPAATPTAATSAKAGLALAPSAGPTAGVTPPVAAAAHPVATPSASSSRSNTPPRAVATASVNSSQRALQTVPAATPAPPPMLSPVLAVASGSSERASVPQPAAAPRLAWSVQAVAAKPVSPMQLVAPKPASQAAPTAAAGAAAAATGAAAVRSPTDVWYPPVNTSAPAREATEEPRASRSLRPWIALALLIAALAAVWQFGGKHEPALGSRVATPSVGGDVGVAPAPPVNATAGPPDGDTVQPMAGGSPATAGKPYAAVTPGAPSVTPRRTEPTGAAESATPANMAPVAPLSAAAAGAAQEPVRAATIRAPVAAAEDAQIRRSRVATLVAGGTRALNALEPATAAAAFAAALAIAPEDAAARDGSQRARRLAGVAALMQDARDAGQRGDHARAVQGYSQALSNDPRNRGLAEALATARRNLASDAAGSLLAEGHAALGGGRLEAAQAAFERALELNPRAPGARAGIVQATTAIALRDAAASRRPASNDTAP